MRIESINNNLFIKNRQIVHWYKSKFYELERSSDGAILKLFYNSRQDAIEKLAEIGFPTSKDEEWKFTDISPILNFEFLLGFKANNVILKQDIEFAIIPNAVNIVFVNGIYAPELSNLNLLPKGVIACNILDSIQNYSNLIESNSRFFEKDNAFVQLNTAFWQDGAFILVQPGVDVEVPIQLVFVSNGLSYPFVSHPRNVIIAQDSSQLKLIETYVGISESYYMTNSVTKIFIGKESHVEHNKIQIEATNGFHIENRVVRLSKLSRYAANSISLGSSLARNELNINIDGEKAKCGLKGLTIGTDKQVLDDHTSIIHSGANSTSDEVYKFILSDLSHGIFNGKIVVLPNAQRTDSRQTNRTLVLSDDAKINTKPQLEIFNDDVKCTHGATVGKLDDDQIFYLRSRGISLEEAKFMLINSFASEILKSISNHEVHNFAQKFIANKLKKLISL